MEFDTLFAKTPASMDEIRVRVGNALDRHPLCRDVQFDVVWTPRATKGGNWTVNLRSVASDALWEASDIVADIQEAYDLSIAG
jgi:hypothetical protein